MHSIVDMLTEMETIDLFTVLRSRTRRDILKELMKREMHVSGIAREFGISVPQASKHCKLLEEKGLVHKRTFGRTQILRARTEGLYGLMDYFSDETNVEVSKGSNIIDALTQVAGVKIERADDRGFVTSIDGEEGYYIYEVNGKAPPVAMDKFRIEKDSTVELKKILYVKKKNLKIKVKKRE
jgi:DNA-binding transcriptional ArsR family regulator